MVKVLPKDCQFGEAVIIALIRKKVSPSGHGGWGRYARPVGLDSGRVRMFEPNFAERSQSGVLGDGA